MNFIYLKECLGISYIHKPQTLENPNQKHHVFLNEVLTKELDLLLTNILLSVKINRDQINIVNKEVIKAEDLSQNTNFIFGDIDLEVEHNSSSIYRIDSIADINSDKIKKRNAWNTLKGFINK